MKINVSKSKCNSWNILFFGSDYFSILSLKELLHLRSKKIVENIEVVTSNTETSLFKFASSNSIKTHIWPPIINKCFDIGVVVSFGKLIPQEIIKQFPLGIINTHASLLPRWRGSMPMVYAIKFGDTKTGITIQKINPDKFDTGSIIMQRSCCIAVSPLTVFHDFPTGENELMPSLYKRLAIQGSKCLGEVISKLPDSIANCYLQSTESVTYAKKLNKDIAIIKWNDMTAREIYNLYRAVFGLFDLKTTWRGSSVKLTCISLNLDDSLKEFGVHTALPGRIIYIRDKQVLLVMCRDKPIKVCSLKFNNKLYTAHDFNQGYLTQCSNENWVFGF